MWKKLDIGGRISFLTAVCCLFVTATMVLMTFVTLQSNRTEVRLRDAQTICRTGSSTANSACSYIRGVADFYGNSSDIAYILERRSDDPEAAEMAAEMFSVYQSDNYVLSIVLYNTLGTPLQYMSIDGSDIPVSQINSAEFKELIVSRNQQYRWEYIPQNSDRLFRYDNSPKLCLWRIVKSSNNRTVYGAVAVTIDVRNLLTFDVAYNSQYRKLFSLFDRGSSAFVADSLGGRKDTVASMLSNVSDDSGTLRLERTGDYVLYETVHDTGLYITYVTIDDNRVSAGDAAIVLLSGLLAFALIIVPTGFYIRKSLTKPLYDLKAKIEQFTEGDMISAIEGIEDTSIGKVSLAFNNMIAENRKLIEEKDLSALRLRESQLTQLQSNINPHFLYNTINAIQWQAQSRGEQDLADMANAFGQIMRITLSRGSKYIPVAKECELTGCYLSLQKRRYGKRLEYSINCVGSAKDVLIPKMILQPIVENSINHCINECVDTLHITVDAWLEGKELVIEVSDDGCGIAPEILEKLPANYKPEDPSSSGYAIRNIYERLSLIYSHGRFLFDFVSQQDSGTFVTFRLPNTITCNEQE